LEFVTSSRFHLCAMVLALTLLLSLFAGEVSAISKELSDANFDKTIQGKNALLWFHAPW